MVYRDAPQSCGRCGRIVEEQELLFDEHGMLCWQCAGLEEVDRHLARAGIGGRTRISDLKVDGTHTIVGVAHKHETTCVAPLTQRACFLWSVVVADAAEEHVLAQDAGGVDFDLTDGSGVIRVVAAHASLIGSVRLTHRAGALEDELTAPMVEYLAQKHIATTTRFGTARALRLVESAVAEGDTVRVEGHVTFDGGRRIAGLVSRL